MKTGRLLSFLSGEMNLTGDTLNCWNVSQQFQIQKMIKQEAALEGPGSCKRRTCDHACRSMSRFVPAIPA
jgi:hypothetical protein